MNNEKNRLNHKHLEFYYFELDVNHQFFFENVIQDSSYICLP